MSSAAPNGPGSREPTKLGANRLVHEQFGPAGTPRRLLPLQWNRECPYMSKTAQQVVIWSLGLLVTVVMVLLGLWQAQTFRTQGKDSMVKRMTQPAVPLSEIAVAGQVPGDAYGRPVTTSGRYLPEQQVLVPATDQPGSYRVVTVLELADGSIVPVVRGVNPGTTPPAPPTGQVDVAGLFLPTEAPPGPAELPAGQLETVRLQRLVQVWDQPLVSGYINLDQRSAEANGLTAAEVAVPDSSGQARNEGYALQWWIFAVASAAATIKLSRDARTQTGWMAPAVEIDLESAESTHSVDNSGDKQG